MEYWCYFFPAFAVATPLWFWFWSSAKKGFGWSPGGCAGWKTIPNLTDSTKGSQGLVGLVDVLRIITGILTQSILPQGFWKEFIRIVNEKIDLPSWECNGMIHQPYPTRISWDLDFFFPISQGIWPWKWWTVALILHAEPGCNRDVDTCRQHV